MTLTNLKQEIALNISSQECCKLAFCKGLMDSCCHDVDGTYFDTKNRFGILARSILQQYDIEIYKYRRLLRIEGENIPKLILDLSLLQLNSHCCQTSYLSSVFLGCGNLSISRNYQLSFILHRQLSSHLRQLMQNLGVPPKILQRDDKYIVYIKDSQLISDCLILMGAIQNSLDLNNIIASADKRKNINRGMNCINANLDKTVSTSQKHIQAINQLKTTSNFDVLSDQDKATANARTRYPELTLQELADHLKISKSGIKHRLDKILQISQDLRM